MSKRSDQRYRAAKRRYIDGEPPREQPRRVTVNHVTHPREFTPTARPQFSL